MQMKLIAPLVLVTWLLSDYTLCHQRADIAWDLLIAAINKPVALVTTVRKVRSLLALLVQKKYWVRSLSLQSTTKARRSCHYSTQGIRLLLLY
jgi:hypothetical protein